MTNLTTITLDVNGVPVVPPVTIGVDKTAWEIVRVVRDNQYTDDYADIYYKIGLGEFNSFASDDDDTVTLYRTVYEDGSAFNSVSVEFV